MSESCVGQLLLEWDDGHFYVANEVTSHWCEDLMKNVLLKHPRAGRLQHPGRSSRLHVGISVKVGPRAFEGHWGNHWGSSRGRKRTRRYELFWRGAHSEGHVTVALAALPGRPLAHEGVRGVSSKRHKRIDVALALARVAAPEFFPCFLLEQTVSGSRLLWSLKDLYEQVIGKGAAMTASRWMNSWWSWWVKTLEAHGVGVTEAHLRRGSNGATRELTEYRIFEVPCISTVALLLLVTKWSGKSKSGTTKNPQAQTAWENVLKALVQRCRQEEDWDMAVYLDTAVECKVGFPSKGNRLVKLPVRRGQVDMSAILDCQDAGVHASLSKLTPQPCTVMGLPQWLQLLDGGGRKMQWLFKQVINLLAERLEAKVGAEFQAGDTAAGRQADMGKQDLLADAEVLMTPAEGRASRRRNKFAAGVRLSLNMTLPRTVLKYFYARRARLRNCDVLHVAFDASRVGGWQALIGFATTGSGSAMWLPPQAQVWEKHMIC
ncbi:unnamed protein product [Symbiodinium sp. CCMP2592]|nr:unnamed protein product [Symbiodinium sp. CCMP2592]